MVSHFSGHAPSEPGAAQRQSEPGQDAPQWLFFLGDGRALTPIPRPECFELNPRGDIDPGELYSWIELITSKAREVGLNLPPTNPDSFRNPRCHVAIPEPQVTLEETISELGQAFEIMSTPSLRGSDLHNWWHRQLGVPFSQRLPWE